MSKKEKRKGTGEVSNTFIPPPHVQKKPWYDKDSCPDFFACTLTSIWDKLP
jgi:hypothetical protein